MKNRILFLFSSPHTLVITLLLYFSQYIFSLFDADIVTNVISKVKFKGNIDSRDILSPLDPLPLKRWFVLLLMENSQLLN